MSFSDGTEMAASGGLRLKRLANAIPASYSVFKIGSDYYAETNIAGGTNYGPLADLSTIIQNAVDAISTGGSIYLGLTGTGHTLTSAINFDAADPGNQITIFGRNMYSTRLAINTDINGFEIEDDDVTIRDLRLNVEQDPYTKDCILLDSTSTSISRAFVQNVFIYRAVALGYEGQGIHLAGDTNGIVFAEFDNVHVMGGFEYAALLDCASGYINGTAWRNCVFSNVENGIYMNPSGTGVTNRNMFTDMIVQCNASTLAPFTVDDTANMFIGCQTWDLTGGNNTYVINAGATDTTIIGGCVSGDGISDAGTTSHFHAVSGYITENSGSDTIASGTTSKVVAHGLDVTPNAEDFSIIGKENPTNDVGTIWVDTIGAANFTVNVEANPGVSNWDFGWRVRSKY